jgi:formaldehyde-activating enzyme involved in methanogenesis
MSRYFLLAAILVSLSAHGQTPVITSISPASGKVGSTVIINGANFGATPAGNIVYFGGVKAVVSAATANALTLTVPDGATP